MAKYLVAKSSENVLIEITKDMVDSEKSKHFIGEVLFPGKNKGTIIGIYPDFALVQFKNYKTCIQWKDLYFGGLSNDTGRR